MLRRWFSRLSHAGRRQLSEQEALRLEEEALSHLDALYRTALRLTRNRQDAEDLVQDTYTKVFRFADRYEPGTNLRAWMFKIMTNTFLNSRRRVGARPPENSLDDMEEYYLYNRLIEPGASNLSASAEDQALSKILDVDVTRALDELPEAYRLAIQLHDVEGFTYREVAEMLQIPIGTVMSRLSRGRRLLQRGLWRREGKHQGTDSERGSP